MVNQEFTIKDLQSVLKGFNSKFTNIRITRLTAAGENYLSLVFKVDFEVSKENGLRKPISIIAKRLPKQASEDGMRLSSLAMKNEIRWYLEMVPLFKKIANECGICCDYFPVYLGSRLSLDPEKTCADEESVLLMENLLIEGFKNGDRYVGFDLRTSKAFLKTIASFHAITLAAKFKNPPFFHKIKHFIDNLPNPEPEIQEGCHHPERLVMDLMLEIPACQPYRANIEALIETAIGTPVYVAEKEPWNTVIHGDFWLNNVMVKDRDDGEPLTKLLDFQFLGFSSYAIDVVFFLLTSVKSEVQMKHFDELLRYYYDQLTSILDKLDIPELTLTYEDYLEEVKRMALKSECKHAFFFTTIVYGPKGTGPDPLLGEVDLFENLENLIRNMGDLQKKKLGVMTEVAAKRGWI